MKNRTKTILTVSFDMDDLYQVFADENIPSTDENVEQVLSEETKKKLRDSAFQKGLDVLREQVKELENKGEEKEAGFLEFCQDEWEYTAAVSMWISTEMGLWTLRSQIWRSFVPFWEIP